MAFTVKLPEAALRNLQAAEQLDAGPRRDVAGYLYGLAAECAIKEMLKPVPIPPEHDKNAMFYAHFPELRTLLRDALKGRGMQSIWTVVVNDRFMHNWDIRMRYADARQIQDKWVDDWKQQAKQVVNKMGT